MAPTCSDGTRNGTETDIDCGGSCPTFCANGLSCLVDHDCVEMSCEAGVCVGPSCMDGMRNGAETDVDCGGSCAPCGDLRMCAIASDCASGICTSMRCQIPRCTDGVQNGAERGIDCGGSCAAGCPDGTPCTTRTDCTSLICEGGTCAPYSCMDGMRNGPESDVDCGGPCAGCADGRMCGVSPDCASGVCTSGSCAMPSCMDGVQNGMETGIDCGGGCTGCADGAVCMVGPDCRSGVCTAMTCAVPTCIDGIWNGMETDVDCGGATTCPRCADLRRCTAPSDCMTAACTRGRCGTRGGCHWALISQETQLGDTTITGLLTANGHTFDLYNSNTTGTHTSNATLIAMYQTIIFQKHDRVISATEQTVLQNFVNGGGRLLVTGYDSLGSPTDTLLASLLNCTGPADGPFSNVLSVVSATHPIMMGPAATFTVGMALTASSTDHDSCTPGGAAIRLVSVSGTSSKLQVTDNVGVGHGRVVYWNGNGSGSGALTDWTGAGGTQPALQNLFVNVLNHLCSP